MIENVLIAWTILAASQAASGEPEPVTFGERVRMQSAVLNEAREYQVSLPGSYPWAKNQRYPVLYVLDGQTQFEHTAAAVRFLADHGEIPELIVVGITSTVRIRDFTQTDWATHWVGGGGANNFKKFLSSELIPEVERRFRAAEYRVLSGHSAGGQFVLYCLASEPALFQGYLAIAPSLDWDDRLPQRSLEQSFEATRELRSFLYVARADDSGAPLADFEGLVATLRTKSPQGLRWHSAAYPDETHVSVPLIAQIDAVRRLYDGYRFHNDLLPKGLAFAEQHFRTVSEKVGSTIEVPEAVINELGYQALGDGKVAEAIVLFQRNVESHPQSSNAFDSLADGLAKAGRWPEAVKASERAAALANEFDHPSRESFVERAKKMREKAAEVEKAK